MMFDIAETIMRAQGMRPRERYDGSRPRLSDGHPSELVRGYYAGKDLYQVASEEAGRTPEDDLVRTRGRQLTGGGRYVPLVRQAAEQLLAAGFTPAAVRRWACEVVGSEIAGGWIRGAARSAAAQPAYSSQLERHLRERGL
jgi:hypothetical protein